MRTQSSENYFWITTKEISVKKNHYLNSITVALALGSVAGLAQACNAEPYIGGVCVFAQDWCPRGYIPADGRTLQVRDYQALFSLLGFRYGGNNVDQFQIPDLRGRSVVGTGQGAGLPTAVNLAQKVGQQAVVLTAAQTPVQSHTHPAVLTPTFGPVQLNLPATQGNLDVKAALPVDPAVGSVTGQKVGLTSGTSGYLAAMTGTNGVDAITFTGPYTANKPGANSAFLEAAVKLSGTAATAASTATVQAMTGGAVAVGTNTVVQPSASVSTQSPAMGMSVCIAALGLYPDRP
jgi:microcystin-dependent protein